MGRAAQACLGVGTVTTGGRWFPAASVASSLRSQCELFLGPPLLSSHNWPGSAPQVVQRIANVFLSVSPLIRIRFVMPRNGCGKLFAIAHSASAENGGNAMEPRQEFS
jgi:hypothetical protein